MATNFADLASHYWGLMRHWEKQVNLRDTLLAQLAADQADQRYHRRKVADWERAVEAVEAELVDNDRRRNILIGKQQFAQRMHDSCVLQATMRGHRPTFELDVDLSPEAQSALNKAARLPRQADHSRYERVRVVRP